MTLGFWKNLNVFHWKINIRFSNACIMTGENSSNLFWGIIDYVISYYSHVNGNTGQKAIALGPQIK